MLDSVNGIKYEEIQQCGLCLCDDEESYYIPAARRRVR